MEPRHQCSGQSQNRGVAEAPGLLSDKGLPTAVHPYSPRLIPPAGAQLASPRRAGLNLMVTDNASWESRLEESCFCWQSLWQQRH